MNDSGPFNSGPERRRMGLHDRDPRFQKIAITQFGRCSRMRVLGLF
jgi:hypothetical protein